MSRQERQPRLTAFDIAEIIQNEDSSEVLPPQASVQQETTEDFLSQTEATSGTSQSEECSPAPTNNNSRRIDEGDENVENCLTPVIPRVTSRKRYAQPQTWKRNILKKARQTGTQVSVDDTTTLEKKVNLGDLCNDNCRYRCNATLTEGNRRRIFQEYYEKCVTVNEKNQFIRTGNERNVPQRHKSDPTTHSRDNSYHYFLMVSTMSYMQIFWLF